MAICTFGPRKIGDSAMPFSDASIVKKLMRRGCQRGGIAAARDRRRIRFHRSHDRHLGFLGSPALLPRWKPLAPYKVVRLDGEIDLASLREAAQPMRPPPGRPYSGMVSGWPLLLALRLSKKGTAFFTHASATG